MNLFKLLKLEFTKIRTSFIKYTLILPILISLCMLVLDLLIRKNVIIYQYNPKITDGFQSLLVENHLSLIWPILLLLSIICNSISLFYIDSKNNSLIHILTTQVSRSKYYISKLVTILLCTIFSIILEGILLVILGHVFNVSSNIDVPLVVRYMWLQIFTSLGIIGVQLLLFSLSRKVTLLASINVAALCASIVFIQNSTLNKIIPYLIISNSLPLSVSSEKIIYSVCASFIIFVIPCPDFINASPKLLFVVS